MTCRMLLPSDQPANWSGVPSGATAVFGADSSRWKPSTPVNVRGVLTGTPSSVRPRPGGDVARVSCDFRGKMLTTLLVDRPLAVGRGHLDLVRGVGRRLAGRRDRERSRPAGQRSDERVEVSAVVQPDLGLDVAVVQVEARRVAGERVVGDRVARPVQLALGRRRRRSARARSPTWITIGWAWVWSPPPRRSGARCRRPSRRTSSSGSPRCWSSRRRRSTGSSAGRRPDRGCRRWRSAP